MSLQNTDTSSAAFPLQPLHLVEEISHRVFNEYTEAIATLRVAAADAGNEQVGAALSNVAMRLLAHADAHRALLAPADGSVNLADYVGKICASMSRASLAPKGVELFIDADEIWLESDRCWRIGLIVAELIRNAARHGLRGGPGAVRVSIAVASGSVSCLVSDNGRLEGAPQPGRGCKLVEALAAELGGSIDWRFTPAGCFARLETPETVAAEPLLAGRIATSSVTTGACRDRRTAAAPNRMK